jgi:Zn-dependent peptidase ImmA (M78 family)
MCRAEDVEPSADKTLEREANVFAAELLMPENSVRAVFREPDSAERFGVSAEAMAWRLYNFDLAPLPPGS